MTLTDTAPRLVEPATRLRGSVWPPSDKSIAHRALLFNAMAAGEADVFVRKPGADVRSTAQVLQALGALQAIEELPDGVVRFGIRGGGSNAAAVLPGSGGETLDCSNSGTTVRLVSGALAGRPTTATPATLIGDESLSRRPMERIARPLREMGAEVETTEGRLPLRVRGTRPLKALHHQLPVASAQVLGAVTLAALAAEGCTTIDTPGPTRDHTERMLSWMGAPVRRNGLTTTVQGPAGFAARSISVPDDISSAAAWLVAGAIHPNANVSVGAGLNPSRLAIVDVLREMGASIEITEDQTDGPEPAGTLTVRSAGALRGIHLSGARVAELIDELPLLAVAMAAADGMSEVRDAGELRVKESDRIALVVRNLRAIGAVAEELPDGWRVRRGVRTTARITTAGDHRIAMAFAIAAATGVADSVEIDDPDCVDVSYPGFWDDLSSVSA